MEGVLNEQQMEENALKFGLLKYLETVKDNPSEVTGVYRVPTMVLPVVYIACILLMSIGHCFTKLIGTISCVDNIQLHSFWQMTVYSDIASVLYTSVYIFTALKEEYTQFCTDIQIDTSALCSGMCMVIITLYIFVGAKSVTAVLLFHSITKPEKLIKILQVSVFNLNLLVLLVPSLILLDVLIAYKKSDAELMTICLDSWIFHYMSWPFMCGTFLGLAVLCIIIWRKTTIEFDVFLPFLNFHLVPVLTVSSFVSTWMANTGFPNCFPIIFIVVSAINKFLGFQCYRLFVKCNPEEVHTDSIIKDKE